MSIKNRLLTNKDYKDILTYYQIIIPKSKRLLKITAENIMSEKFTSYQMTPDELSAKGRGGSRQMYNYVSANDEMQFINTPADSYRPDKLSNSVTIDTLQQKRMDEVNQLVSKNAPFGNQI